MMINNLEGLLSIFLLMERILKGMLIRISYIIMMTFIIDVKMINGETSIK